MSRYDEMARLYVEDLLTYAELGRQFGLSTQGARSAVLNKVTPEDLARREEALERIKQEAKPFSAGDGDPRHGTVNGYGNLKCRCPECKAANTARLKEYREANPEVVRQANAKRRTQLHEQARNVLSIAASCGMPDTFWQTDSRILSACKVLSLTPTEARLWAEENAPRRV